MSIGEKNSAVTKDKHYKTNYNHSNITKQTRQESYILRPVTRAREILKVLDGNELTAREIAQRLGSNDRGYVAPRLTEMKEAGLIEVIGKKKDHITDRNVAVWRLRNVE